MNGSGLLVRANVGRSIPFGDGVFHCVVTSPPYFGLRDYGTADQLGLEKTPEEYVAKMVGVFREAWRVLRDDGTFWLNIGDCYNAYNGNRGASKGKANANHHKIMPTLPSGYGLSVKSLKPKDLIGIPWMLALALRADGWYLRQEVIWDKPNPMTESVKDRPSRSHEHVFLLTKMSRYYYDAYAVREPGSDNKATQERRKYPLVASGRYGDERLGNRKGSMGNDDDGARNVRSVWRIPVGGYRGAHFATMPTRLAARCVLAGTSAKGCCPSCGKPWNRMVERTRTATRPGKASKVSDAATSLDVGNRDTRRHVTTVKTLGWQQACDCPSAEPVPCRVFDPFGGAGTTPKVAAMLGRQGFATELSADYLVMARERMDKPERIGPKKPGASKVVAPSPQQTSFFDLMEATP